MSQRSSDGSVFVRGTATRPRCAHTEPLARWSDSFTHRFSPTCPDSREGPAGENREPDARMTLGDLSAQAENSQALLQARSVLVKGPPVPPSRGTRAAGVSVQARSWGQGTAAEGPRAWPGALTAQWSPNQGCTSAFGAQSEAREGLLVADNRDAVLQGLSLGPARLKASPPTQLQPDPSQAARAGAGGQAVAARRTCCPPEGKRQ